MVHCFPLRIHVIEGGLKHRLSDEVAFFVVGVNCVQSVECGVNVNKERRLCHVVYSLHLCSYMYTDTLLF